MIPQFQNRLSESFSMEILPNGDDVSETTPTLYRVFLIDCDSVIHMASDEDHRLYFPTLAKTFRVLRILYKIGHLDEKLICDYKAWVVVTAKAIIACSKNAYFNPSDPPNFWEYYLKQINSSKGENKT